MPITDRREAVAEGLAVKAPCRVATTANITLSGEQTIDGVAVVEGDRVLVKSQSTGADNGIYTVSTGVWERTRDFDGAYDIVTGTRVFVTSGTIGADFEYAVSTTGNITVGTTSISFLAIGSQSAATSAAAAASSSAAAAISASVASGLIWTTGDVKLTLKATAESGWRMFDDGTIGDASSGATYANSAAEALFTLLFDNIADASAPILTSAGAGTTRAAQTNAAVAWAAHCRMSLPKALGRALGVSGAGSGLTSRALGLATGAETVTLAQSQLPTAIGTITVNDSRTWAVTAVTRDGGRSVTSGSGDLYGSTANSSLSVTPSGSITATIANSTGGNPTDNMSPVVFLNAMVKL